MRQLAGLLALALFATPVLAEAPDSSHRPVPRPGVGAAEQPLEVQAAVIVAAAASDLAPVTSMRPLQRPGTAVAAAPVVEHKDDFVAPVARAGLVVAPTAIAGLFGKLRPEPRPEAEARPEAKSPREVVEPVSAMRTRPNKSAVSGRKGSVCGVNGIKGEEIARVTSRVRGCGIDDPVRVTSVDGVQLSTPATIDCGTAKALESWVRKSLKPAFGRTDVVRLQVAASYACRPRNNVRGAKISEHGKGNAIDISAIVLENGKTVSVLNDWRNRSGKPMVKAYRAACGTFGTTLGPDSDRHHRDHMHFDTASYRSGAYCR